MSGRLIARCASATMIAALICAAVLTGPARAQADQEQSSKPSLLDRSKAFTAALEKASQTLAALETMHGSGHPLVAASLYDLASLYKAQGLYSEAEPLYRRSLAIREVALEANRPDLSQSLNGLANLYSVQGRFGEPEPLYERALSIREKVFGRDHPLFAETLNDLADLYTNQGRYEEAEQRYKRALEIRERALGLDHLDVAQTLNDLADLFTNQGRFKEPEDHYKRALAIREKALGLDHPKVATTLNNLGDLYTNQDRLDDAGPQYERALAIREKAFGPDHPDVAQTLNDIGDLNTHQVRFDQAERHYQRALAIRKKSLGADNPHTAQTLHDLADLYAEDGRYGEAEAFYWQALAIRQAALGLDHPHVGQSLSSLADLYYVQGEWTLAAEYGRRGIDVLVRRARRGAGDVSQSLTGKRAAEVVQEAQRFRKLVKAAHRLASERPSEKTALAAEMFKAVQWPLSSSAAQSLALMAVRGAKGDPHLSALVRERQDKVAEWKMRDAVRSAVIARPPDQRDRNVEAANMARLSALENEITAIDHRLKSEFPDYGELSQSQPLTVTDVQALLGDDEALVLFFDTPEDEPLPGESFVWAVTRTDMRWVRIGLGTRELNTEVTTLRCGLDEAAWDIDGGEACAKSTASPFVKPLPFDHARAHKLYAALLGDVHQLIKGKHLLVVPSGPLTLLPFHVLVTKPPASKDHSRAAWLVREHSVSVLPAVSSLSALRRLKRSRSARWPMIGFGNPLLSGPADMANLASQARDKQSCPDRPAQHLLTRARHRAAAVSIERQDLLADMSSIRALDPLPETADELCAVAQDMNAQMDRDILLGAKATEREVKRRSANGELSNYRIVHFATHGVLGDTLTGMREPGLVLTPPDVATEADDGYLSASEIAALRLDADWVILSACNTAAGSATSAEALSGLARAFIYAQARALLVSHWAVYSTATVKLITGAVGEMTRQPHIGRAGALRRAMLALIEKGAPHEAHPAFWAPFVVVGEGAPGR